MVSDRVKQHLAEFEDRACTCGAGHGSLEGHTDWCDWSEYLSAAACVREEDNAVEPVAWGEDIDGKIVSVRLDKSRHCTVPLYRAPQPSRAPTSLVDAEKAFMDRVWPKLQNGCYRTHGSNPVKIQGLDFNEFVRDGLCAVLEAADPQPSGKTEEAAQIIQAFIDQGIDYIMRNNRVEEALHHLKIIESEANRVTNPVTKNNLLYEIERIRSSLAKAQEQGRGARGR